MAKLLLVDDDALLTRIYQKEFADAGHEVVTAKDGEEGLALVEQEQPDLMMLDLMMPNLSGLEALERIKANPAISSIPVAILSNIEDEQAQEQAIELGAVAYIVKSKQHPNKVVAKVREILEASTRGKDVPKAVTLD